jgi:hypothetical protein
MRLSPLSIGLTVLALASARDVFACECPSAGPPCQNAFQVDAVFAGTVRSIVPLQEADRHFARAKGGFRKRFEWSSTLWCRSAASRCRTQLCLQRVVALRAATASNRASGILSTQTARVRN